MIVIVLTECHSNFIIIIPTIIKLQTVAVVNIELCKARNKHFVQLKGLRHEGFAILGQFSAKIITKCLYSYTKCSCKAMRKISNEFYQGELTIITFWEFLKT